MKIKKYYFLLIALLLSGILHAQITISNDSVGKGKDDGRFTIGSGTKRLMYGYPIPTSTSHFVIAVDNDYASNNPKIGTYLSGTNKITGDSGSIHMETVFVFRQIKITQKLTPVDPFFKPVALNKYGNYYKIEYLVENLAYKDKKVGLILLIDTMIDDNDACMMDADGNKIRNETLFTGHIVPHEILAYRMADEKNDLMATCITEGGGLHKPDKLYIGRWANFQKFKWDVKLEDVRYSDSAILLKWEKHRLELRGKATFGTYYGLPKHKKPNLSMIPRENDLKEDVETVYFDTKDYILDYNAKVRLDVLIGKRKIKGITISGYSDAAGKDQANLKMSLNRTKAVEKYLQKYKLSVPIISRAFGELQADESEESVEHGNSLDRRVVVTIYYKDVVK